MTEAKHCSKCGAQIPARARWGVCPGCLLEPASRQSPEESSKVYTATFSRENRRFGDYQLGRQIGRGGMGVVYEAVQLKLRRSVALKMILDSHLSSPSRRRFAIEAEAAAKLDHPNIVPIYEVGEHGDQPFLSMKLVQGESLRIKIASGELGVAGNSCDQSKSGLRNRQLVAARLIALIARAVQHAHEQGVLHRDVKPGNIIIDRSGQPHLTDFGLAKLLDQTDGDGAPATQSSAMMGTPSYMSPEQASNQPLSAASDVYGLGAILYELLTGQPPFKASTVLETIRRVAEQEPRRPRAVHPRTDADLETVCLKCLEKNPATRYSSALALAEDLERWLRQEPIRARPAGPVLRTRRWIKRNPLGAGLIASLCAGLMVSLLMLQMSYRTKKHLDILAAVNQNDFTRRVEEFWAQPDREFVELNATELAALNRRIPREPNSLTLTLKFAVTISDNPVGQATAFAPFLGMLQDRMEKLLGRSVLFTFRLYKTRSWDSPALGPGDVDVQRISALTYARLTQAGLAVQPLARGRGEAEAVVFASKNSGIGRLSDIPGHSIAFAHTNSIISFWAKVYLARAGICGTNLKFFHNLVGFGTRNAPSTRPFSTADPSDGEADDYAHREVIERVVTGEYDVGVAPRRRFELMNSRRREGLIEIGHYAVPRNVFAARPGLDTEMVAALRQALISIKNQKILGQLGRATADGIVRALDSDFDDMRKALTNEVRCFENVQPVPASDR
jgi:serine/threonine protein kinase/ABC-type phosphate/phosphonate transport system substrate-binding protein